MPFLPVGRRNRFLAVGAAAIIIAAIGFALVSRPRPAQPVTLHVGDQRGAIFSLLKAAGELDDVPYRIDWATFAVGAPLVEAIKAGAVDFGYVNGVYNARPSIAVFDVFDVASVNVLRGPQGTLFGKNSVAGVIEVNTNPASYEPEIAGEISYGNYNFSQIKVAASAPLGNSGFAVRLAGIKSDRDGTIYNSRFQDGWQDYHNKAVRGELAYRNSDETFTARLIGDVIGLKTAIQKIIEDTWPLA